MLYFGIRILIAFVVTADAIKPCCRSGRKFDLETLSCVDLETPSTRHANKTSNDDLGSAMKHKDKTCYGHSDSETEDGSGLDPNEEEDKPMVYRCVFNESTQSSTQHANDTSNNDSVSTMEQFDNDTEYGSELDPDEEEDEPMFYHCVSNKFMNLTLSKDHEIPTGSCEVEVDNTTYWTECRMKVKSCCPSGMTYDLTNDSCIRRVNFTSPPVAVTFHSSNEFHSYKDVHVNYSYNDFEFNISKPDCPHPLQHFPGENILFDISNQYLILQEVDTTKVAWEPDTYCLAVDDTGSLIARMCYQDPCIGENLTNFCAKTCCQPGHVLDYSTHLCEPMKTFVPLEVPVKSKTGVVNRQITEVFRSVPMCQLKGLETMTMPLGHRDWWLTEKGVLIEEDGRTTSDYCVGVEIKGNESTLVAVRCNLDLRSPTDNTTYFVLLLVSSLFLIAIIFVHLLLKDLLNNHGISITCQSLSIFMVYVCNAVLRSQHNLECEHMVLTMQYFLLANFSWLSIMSVDVALIFRGRHTSRDKKLLVVYMTFAWGIPAIVTLTASLLNRTTKIIETEHYCWFVEGYVWYFIYGPTIALLALNSILFVHSSLSLVIASLQASALTNKDRKRAKDRLFAILKLFLLAGLLWTLDIVSGIMELKGIAAQVLFVLTVLIPVLIFFAVVVNRRVLDLFGLTYPSLGEWMAGYGWEPKTRLSRFSTLRFRSTIRKSANASTLRKQSNSQPDSDPITVQTEVLNTAL